MRQSGSLPASLDQAADFNLGLGRRVHINYLLAARKKATRQINQSFTSMEKLQVD